MKIPPVVFLGLGTLLFSLANGWNSAGIQEPPKNNGSLPKLTIGLILPHTNFGVREYIRAINKAVLALHRAKPKFSFLEKYQFTQQQVRNFKMQLSPSPTGKWFSNYETSNFMRSIIEMPDCCLRCTLTKVLKSNEYTNQVWQWVNNWVIYYFYLTISSNDHRCYNRDDLEWKYRLFIWAFVNIISRDDRDNSREYCSNLIIRGKLWV